MIRLGLRLAVAGGKEAISRLALIAIAVAIGVALLLVTLATSNAFSTQNHRYAWLNTGYSGATHDTGSRAKRGDPLWWSLRADYFHGTEIGRIDLAASGPHSPIPPGLSALPGPGQFYASPSMAKLLRTTPRSQLGDRYPGTLVGTIGADALPAPDSLIIIIGRQPGTLARSGVPQITRISTTSPNECTGDCAPIGTDANGITLVLSVVAAAVLFPVLMFIGGATRLSAARREQRFAAMRLVGATARQVSRLATVESSVASVIGVAGGFGLFAAFRPVIATIPFNGERFFSGDLSLTTTNVVIVAVGVPVIAALAARIALRRVNISPLGVSRRVTPRPPRPARLVPLTAGLAWLAYLAYFSDISASKDTAIQAYAYLLGVFTVMVGLVVAGPWLTLTGSRVISRRLAKPAGLIAARRLGDDPKVAFRAISGLVLAVFVASVAIGTITTIVAYNGSAGGATANSRGILSQEMFQPDLATSSSSPPPPSSLVSSAGVRGVAIIHSHPMPGAPLRPEYFVSCAPLSRIPVLGRCSPHANTAVIDVDFGGGVIDRTRPMSGVTWPDAGLTPTELAAIPIESVIVGTDGSKAAVEQARTILEHSYPTAVAPETVAESNADNTKQLDSYRRLAEIVLLTSLPIAGCSLAVSVAGGLSERRRPFSLLRLTGVPLAMLRRVVTLETAVPLLAGILISAVAGLASAALFLRAQLHQTLQPPALGYYLVIAGGAALSLVIIASMFPFLARTTGPETARND